MMVKNADFDLGSVKVHRNALEDIIITTLTQIEGASLAEVNIASKLLALFGEKYHPSIRIKANDNNEVRLEIKVNVRYGLNIPDIARQIQDDVRAAIEKTVDINLKDINIKVLGIERGQK